MTEAVAFPQAPKPQHSEAPFESPGAFVLARRRKASASVSMQQVEADPAGSPVVCVFRFGVDGVDHV